MKEHVFIPDTQVKPGVSTTHLVAAAKYIAARQPAVIVCAGDWWDMPSLSRYEQRGSVYFEGKRYYKDIVAGNDAMEMFLNTLVEHAPASYRPRKVFLMGNHEDRIRRAVEADPVQLEGVIGNEDLALESWEVVPFLQPIQIDGILYCMAPHHKALTADLRWVQLGDLRVGDKLIAFHEFANGPRQYKEATVLRHALDVKPCLRVVTNDGREWVVTPDHQWLARKYGTTAWNWVRTDALDERYQVLSVGQPWTEKTSRAAGYLAGVLDGEGHISRPNRKQGGIQLGFAQKDNACLRQALAAAESLGYTASVHKSAGTDVLSVRLSGSSQDMLRVIGETRALRLIDRFDPATLGRLQQVGEPLLVHSVSDAGVRDIAKVQTSSGTMLVDGVAHHNCHYFQNPQSLMRTVLGGTIDNRLNKTKQSFTMGHQQTLLWGCQYTATGQRIIGCVAGAFYQHQEAYQGPQGNNYWRGLVYKHEVRKGSYDPMFVSMGYLLREWA